MQYFSAYLRHRCRSKRRHGVHSPFAYALGDQVLRQFPQCTYSVHAQKRLDIARAQKDAVLHFLDQEPLPGIGSHQVEVIEQLEEDRPFQMPEPFTGLIIIQPYRYKSLQDTLTGTIRCAVIDTWYILLLLNHPAFLQPEYHRMH